MAKKRFTADLNDLFDNPYPGTDLNYGGGSDEVAGADAKDEETVEIEVPVRSSKAKKKLSSKKFTADLDAFMSLDMDRASGGTSSTDSAPKSRRTAPAAAPRRRRKTGLDLLIRSTISKEEMAEREKPRAPDTKRVTLVFNKAHLVTLKEQAKDRKMYLKDVVQEMVANYLAEQ
ncbi:hypothetical protein [Lewinella sp. 4G2]|uniref:hypothetical protein n=1 Tax=Lewinella sp. 4G2 TaxID=1803372 RepID=UPI0007B493EC|nr:hypothetical protein [Lewinella sp. 4G2]OAV43003.1 hypothetical protein A3850_000135 [Lewinella sp. 4G2]